ncbi:MAG: hypothetical protein LBG83_07285 [Oscillospiraceae bacterium]|jgi:cyclic beta-1,2-glucan synthetase|nr:hypothetical protein [Oscillospiraceae bacterium]
MHQTTGGVGRGYREQLRLGLRALRRQYRLSLRGGRRVSSAAQVYQEWLRDNYYLIARESVAALRELRRCPRRTVGRVIAVCRKLCPLGRVPESEALAQALQKEKLKSAETALVPLALRLVLLEAAVQSAKAEPALAAQLISATVSSLRAMQDIDFGSLLEQLSPLERCLRRDPAGIYQRMDEPSRAVCRTLVAKQARRRRCEEEDYARKLVETAAGAQTGDPARHIGVTLQKNARHQNRGRALLWCETLLPLALSLLAAVVFRAWYLFPLLCLPLWALCRVALEAAFLRGVDPIPLLRLELGGLVPLEGKTLITMSTLLPEATKAGELGRRMERLYGANHGENIAVCVLADLKGADEAVLPQDAADLSAAKKETEALNRKYGGGFYLAVRKRRYSPTMNSYTGWERKRGAILDLARVIHKKKSPDDGFALFCGNREELYDFKYLLALDSDTQLPLGAVPEMVAAALHPANRPQLDPALGRVVSGFGILAPHVDLDLASARATPFAHAMAGEGGSTPYSNQVAERYQDLFGCGIFAGKGLIDVETFVRISELRPFPEERVLSHDILEGGYLRAGFLSDVHVSDGFPGKQASFFARQERWVRGDWQNLPFLLKKRGLPQLSRYQLFDNLRRSLLAPACLLALLASLLPMIPAPAKLALLWAGFLGVCGGHLVSAVRCLCSGGWAMLTRDYYSGGFPAALGDLTRGALQIITLAQAAWGNICGAARGLWRTFFTDKNRLAWTTAAQSEAQKGGWKSWLGLWPSFACATLLLIFGGAGHRLFGLLLLSDLLFAPLSGRPRKPKSAALEESEAEHVRTYCAAMWNYFETYATPEYHYLPPDNVQEAPVFRVAPRTSPTNLGLHLLCVLAARDLDLIDSEGLELRLSRMLDSTEQLERWHGNLLNWYDIRTLRPLEPRYVSTVDSGNFVVSVRTLRMGLSEYLAERPSLQSVMDRLQALESACDLRPLYHMRRRLFHIGMDLSTGKPSPSYYDLLMSEARMTSYYAIAARQAPKKHWGALGRTLARQGRFTGPVSWTGTMFEYFMPYLFLPAPEGTLGYEALRFCLYCQKKRAQGRELPWGNSESGFYAFDADLNYQYKAHGVQKLGLRRGLDEELVAAPYASFLAMQLAPKTALQNLRRFEKMELFGSCGFYEAADASRSRTGGQDYAAVRSYMAHHVGMSLLAALNALQDGIWRRRFMSDGEMASAAELLEEKIPDRAAVYQDVDLRDTPCARERVSSARQVFGSVDPSNPRCHLLSNGEWSSVLTDCGHSATFYRGVNIFRHSEDALRQPSGVSILLREAGQAPVSITPAPYYNAAKQKIEFSASSASYAGEGKQIGVCAQVRVHPRLPAEERRIAIKNMAKQMASGSLFVYFEPCLTTCREESGHPAFSQLFLTDAYDEATGIVMFTRRRRESDEQLCLAAGFNCMDGVLAERSKERAIRRGMPFGSAQLEGGRRGNPEACAAFQINYQLQPGESKELCLFLCAGITPEEAAARLLRLRNAGHKPQRSAQGAPCPFHEGEMPAALAHRILPKLLYYAPLSSAQTAARARLRVPRQALWPLGISGDEPYLYLRVETAEDIPAALPYFSLFRRLRAAGVPCELAVGYFEGGDYDTPVAAALKDALRREHCAHLENQRGGIWIINLRRAEPAALEALEGYAAHLCQEAGDRAQERLEPPLPLLPTKPTACLPAQDRVSAGAGWFLPGTFVVPKTSGAPSVPWSLPLCNPSFGTLVSDSALGFTWAVNSRENKLTPWRGESGCDSQGELLLLKFGSQLYDLCAGARCEFSPQSAQWFGEVHGLAYHLRVSVPGRGLCKRAELTLYNRTAHGLAPELAYFLEPVMGVRREPHLPVQGEALPDGYLFSSPSAQIKGFAALLLQGGVDFVCADRAALLRGNWHTNAAIASDPCVAVGKRLQLPAGEETVVMFALNWGVSRNAALCAHMVAGPAAAQNTYPLEHPDPAMRELLNTWLPHQILHSRLYGRAGHSQCGGAWGFRDQLQDVSALFQTMPGTAKIQIARCAAAQFPEGDALHWWHRLPGCGWRGVRTRYSDDYLWLPYITSEYVAATGDAAFLDAPIPFLQGRQLNEEEHDCYAVWEQGDERASLLEHCRRAVERALRLLGEHGLPLMRGGDWNDGMNRVGAGGQGESVWLGMFLVMVLDGMAALCTLKNESEAAARYTQLAEDMRGVIDREAWTGDRYLRAFWDDGQPLGGDEKAGGAACEIDLLPQAFAALCGMPDRARVNTALDTALRLLGDEEHNMIRLLREPFTHEGRRAGYINDYPPGVRENGGQYTHAAAWLCLALRHAGREDEARHWLKTICPAVFCQESARAARYRGEPYALAGDVSAAPGLEGRAGWTLYTGTAAWFWRACSGLWG